MRHIGIFSGSKTTHFFDEISIELKKIAEGISTEHNRIVYGGGTSGIMGVIPKRFSELGGNVLGIDADMFVKKFEAPSLEQALKLVKTEMGPEALVLSTQEKRSGKLFSRRLVEVTAAAEKKNIP